ncbi:MAG: hypothetical protein N3A61_02080 [Ignavibacteria bacterium]|nr:hypothetical protein [Ignavibacteria bacterium]
MLKDLKIDYCIIDGLAVNAYVEPVISLDIDLAIAVDSMGKLISEAKKYFELIDFSHSYNLSSKKSDKKIQIQKDIRYQDFLKNSRFKNVLGYKLKVASIQDVLLGKIWAYSENQRRPSKRRKDLADILR